MNNINSQLELQQLFNSNIVTEELEESSYSKTRYIESAEFDKLERYGLTFSPYLELSTKCGLSPLPIFKSVLTNRIYIGFLNLGGHRAIGEIRPVKLEHVEDLKYLEKMYSNHGHELDRGIDTNQSYQI